MPPPTRDGHQRSGALPSASSHRRLLLVLGGTGLIAWSAWVSGFHRSTVPAEVTWAVSLVAVVVVDLLLWQGRRHHRPGLRLEPVREQWPHPGHPRHAALTGLSPWLALSLVVLVWEILGIDTGVHEPHLTISALAEAFRPLNAATLVVWVSTGIGYGAARARAPSQAASAAADGPGLAAIVLLAHLSATDRGMVAVPALLLPASRAAGVTFWVAVVAASVAIDLGARRSKGRIPGAGEVVRYVTRSRAANLVVVAAWVFAGYHLFAR